MKPRPIIERAVPLVDLDVGPDGRTVTAYAATFTDPYEVYDEFGHYDEAINRTAFNRTLKHGIAGRVQALFNHGRTIAGTPSDRYSMPLGVPLSVKAEEKGLLTVTRYAPTPLADEVLELIRAGAITAQSFRGDIFASARPKPGPNGRPVIERLELGLKDYGPAPFAVNHAAEILAVRSQILAERLEQLGDLTDEERAELASLLAAPGTPAVDPPTPEDTQDDTTDEVPVDPGSFTVNAEATAARLRPAP